MLGRVEGWGVGEGGWFPVKSEEQERRCWRMREVCLHKGTSILYFKGLCVFYNVHVFVYCS